MSTRFRTLAALLALFAFSASLAEQAWAAACAPAPVEAASTAPAPDHGAMPGHPAPAPEHGPRGHAPAPESGCPLNAVAPAGCTLVLLPAAEVDTPRVDSATGQAIPPAADALPDLLLASGPFRPPQR